MIDEFCRATKRRSVAPELFARFIDRNIQVFDARQEKPSKNQRETLKISLWFFCGAHFRVSEFVLPR
jgi:hypothetical protein